MAVQLIVKRLSRLYDEETLHEMLFEPVGKIEGKPNKEQAMKWLESVCTKLNEKYNGTRDYSVKLLTDDSKWQIRLVKHMHGVDNLIVFADDFFYGNEIKHMIEINQQLDGLIQESTVIKRGEKSQPIDNFKELVDWLMKDAQRGMNIQRYKGLGEMNPEQLWDTTMDPATRRMMQVKNVDPIVTDEVFTTLMGDQVEPRREFIESNALRVENLDV